MKVWNLESWLALYRTNYIFNILYYSFFPHQLVPSFFFFFFFFSFYFLIHTRLVTHVSHTLTLFSVSNFLSSLSLHVVFLFLLLFSFVCIFFNLPVTSAAVLHLIWLFSTSHSSFSLFHCGFFVLLYFFCKVHLFISFLFSSIYLFFLVEILFLQSKLHTSRILNFGWYLSKVSWLKEWGEGFLFERMIQFQSPK